MMDEEIHSMNVVRVRSTEYRRRLILEGAFWGRYTARQQAKYNLYNQLIATKTIAQVMRILDAPCEVDGLELTNREFLRHKSSGHWLGWMVRWFFTILFFPIAIPYLMYWSWRKHGTVDFTRPKSSFLLDEIERKCDEAIAAYQRQEERDNERHERLSTEYFEETGRPIWTLVPLPNYAKLFPSVPASTSSIAECNRENARGAQPQQPMLYINRREEQTSAPTSEEEALNQSVDAMGNLIASITVPLLTGLTRQARAEKTGMPVVTSFRINPPNAPTSDTFTIDIKWHFFWTNAPRQRTTLPFFYEFPLPDDFRPAPRLDALPPAPWYYERTSWQKTVSFFIDSFDNLLQQAISVEGIVNKKRLFRRAYAYAVTDAQRTLLIEHFVNAQWDFHEFARRDTIHSRARGRPEPRMPEAKAAINEWLGVLPDNYQSLSQNAQALHAELREIYALVVQSQLDEAWERFDDLPDTPSHFIQRAFPNLYAMHRQLWVIFTISRHKIYRNETCTVTESQIKGYLEFDLKNMRPFLNEYAPDRTMFIDEQLLAPLDKLTKAGKHFVAGMTKEARDLFYDREMKRASRLYPLDVDSIFRDPDEVMSDDEEEARVIELTS